MEESAELHEVAPGGKVTLGPFEVELLQVNHSIPDAVALAVRTPQGTIIHTADWKLDNTPIDGKLFDTGRFAQLGEEGVMALLSDSTNATRDGFTPSEAVVGTALAPIIKSAKGMVVVSTFASNIHRIQQIVDIAAGLSRRVAFVGRSVTGNVKVSQDLGYLRCRRGFPSTRARSWAIRGTGWCWSSAGARESPPRH